MCVYTTRCVSYVRTRAQTIAFILRLLLGHNVRTCVHMLFIRLDCTLNAFRCAKVHFTARHVKCTKHLAGFITVIREISVVLHVPAPIEGRFRFASATRISPHIG